MFEFMDTILLCFRSCFSRKMAGVMKEITGYPLLRVVLSDVWVICDSCFALLSQLGGLQQIQRIYRYPKYRKNLCMDTVLKVDKIEKYYGNRGNLTKAIDNISFEVEKGEFVGIMGASGSGKTTLLNCISTIDRVTAGNIFIHNQDITNLKGNSLNKFRRDTLGFIFQSASGLVISAGRFVIALLAYLDDRKNKRK